MTATLQVPLQITFHNVPRSDALDGHIRQKAARLEAFQPRITSCRVTVGEIGKHEHQSRQFRIRVDVRMPGHQEFVVNRDHDDDPYVAVREAFDAIERQLHEVVAAEVQAKRTGAGKQPV